MKRFSWRLLSSRRFWQRTVFCSAATATALGLLYAVEDYRGRTALAAYRATAKARGEKLDFEDFAPPPVPAEDNFATTPTFVAMAFTYPSATWALSKIAWPPEVAQFQSPGQHDLARIEAAFIKAGSLAAPADDPAKGILKALEPIEPELAELRRAAERPKSQIPGVLSERFLYPGALRALGSWLNLRTAALLQVGQPASAIKDWMIQMRVCEAISWDPTFASGVLREMLTAEALSEALYETSIHRWTADELATIESALAEIDLERDFIRVMEGQRAWFAGVAETFDRGGTGGPSWARIMPRGWLDQNILAHGLWVDSVLSLLRAHASPKQFEELDAQYFGARHRGQYEPYRWMFSGAVTVIAPNLWFVRHVDRNVQACRIACALERCRLQKGSYPDALAQLAPEFFSAVPLDPTSGLPFEYLKSGPSDATLSAIAEAAPGGKTELWKTRTPVGGTSGIKSEIVRVDPPAVADGTFPLKFSTYQGNPSAEKTMSFFIQVANDKRLNWFIKIGERVPGTDFQLVSFAQDWKGVTEKSSPVDRSKLTLTDSKTGKTIVLTLGQVVRVSDEHLAK